MAASKMDDGKDIGNVIEMSYGDAPRNGADKWDDQAVWATEDKYRGWDIMTSVDTTSNLISDERRFQARFGSEQPNKRPINIVVGEGDLQATNQSVSLSTLYFKTKMCGRFRDGICPNITNCNFAHSIEELRPPEQNWKEIMAALEKERAASAEPEPCEEFQIPSFESSSFMVNQRSNKGRLCRKFYTEEGCSYGDNCSYFHDEELKDRESAAIIVGSGSHGGYSGGGARGGGPVVAPTAGLAEASFSSLKNWKTRICKKFEHTAFCPYGSKCFFAHGAAELKGQGGGLGAPEANPNQQGLVPSTMVAATGLSTAGADGSQQGPLWKWKALEKLSKIKGIYGDWIDEI